MNAYLGTMRTRWSLVVLLTAGVAGLWIVAGQQQQSERSQAGQEDAGVTYPPTLHGKAPTSTPP